MHFIIIIMTIIIINTFLYGAFTKLNAPYNDLQIDFIADPKTHNFGQ